MIYQSMSLREIVREILDVCPLLESWIVADPTHFVLIQDPLRRCFHYLLRTPCGEHVYVIEQSLLMRHWHSPREMFRALALELFDVEDSLRLWFYPSVCL